MKLAEYARDAASLSLHGVNVKAVWRPGHCALALLVRGRGKAQSRRRSAAASLTRAFPRARADQRRARAAA